MSAKTWLHNTFKHSVEQVTTPSYGEVTVVETETQVPVEVIQKKKRVRNRRKKIEDVTPLQFIGELAPAPKLTAAEYWEWRTTIEEMKSAQLELKISVHERDALTYQAEIARLRVALLGAQNGIGAAEDKVAAAKKEYNRYREQLEARLGISLAGKIISDVTFEVREIDGLK